MKHRELIVDIYIEDDETDVTVWDAESGYSVGLDGNNEKFGEQIAKEMLSWIRLMKDEDDDV